MDGTADKSADELSAQAWKNWFKKDYSWGGLLNPEKETEGYASRQAYWLTDPASGRLRSEGELKDAEELIEVSGQKPYHLVHLPLKYADGSLTVSVR